jgi:TonB family protein
MRDSILGRWTAGILIGGLLSVGAALSTATAQDAQRRLDPAFPNYQPAYPDTAQVNGEQGDVVLKMKVSDSGHVRAVAVVRSSGFTDLDNAAVAGVMGWRYLPADSTSVLDNVRIAYRLPVNAPTAPQKP